MNDAPATLSLEKATARVWPVVVVGAGPAGAFLARILARLGIEVLLIDRAAFPRWKVCGCCLNRAAMVLLESSGLGGLLHDCKAVPLSRVRLNAGGRAVDLSLPAGVALSRETFDLALIRAAVSEGAAFLPGTSARFVQGTEHDRRRLRMRQGEDEAILEATLVVAADGLGGQLLTGEPGYEIQSASTAWIGAGTTLERGPEVYQAGTIYMACGAGGYVGLVRLEDGRLDMAAALDPAYVRAAQRCGGLTEAIARILADNGWPVPSLEVEHSWRGTPVLTRKVVCPAGRRYFIVGDAAGYVEPFTGEGMAWAMASANALAPLVARAVRDWQPFLISRWRRRLNTLLRGRRWSCWMLTRFLRSPMLTSGLVRLLSVVPVLARPFLAGLNRPFHLPDHPTR